MPWCRAGFSWVAKPNLNKPFCEAVKIDAERAPPFYPDDQQLVAFHLSYEEMVSRFGPAHRVMDEDDNEPGPCEYWSFVFPCGLSIFITYHWAGSPIPNGVVCASSPAIDHVLEHLPIADCIFWRLDEAEPEIYCQRGGILSSTCPNGNQQNT